LFTCRDQETKNPAGKSFIYTAESVLAAGCSTELLSANCRKDYQKVMNTFAGERSPIRTHLDSTNFRRACPFATHQPYSCNLYRKALSQRRQLHVVSASEPIADPDTVAIGPSSTGLPLAADLKKHKWMWKGYETAYVTAGCGEPILLVHGFGASAGHYRRLIPALAEKYKVYALDLLGFGASEKPIMDYTMELWDQQIRDFLSEFAECPAVLVGNSVGSLATLMVGADAPELVRGVVLLNCAGGMVRQFCKVLIRLDFFYFFLFAYLSLVFVPPLIHLFCMVLLYSYLLFVPR
jgi:hypothetical protein